MADPTGLTWPNYRPGLLKTETKDEPALVTT
jgi:hypothetical protein